MKNRFYLITTLLLIFGLSTNLFANSLQYEELKGVELCDAVYSFLDENNLDPNTYELLSSGDNNFPYNITININSSNYSKKNIIFTFFQEDVLKNKDLIIDIADFLKKDNHDFNTIILFSYGERQIIKKDGMVYGIDSFIENINTSNDYTNIIIDLSLSKNSIDTSSEGIVAPSWLIQNVFNAYLKYGLDEDIPNFYLSQMYTYDFYYNRMLSTFFNYGVPTVKLNFDNSEENKNKISSVIKETLNSYSLETDRSWDRHFFMIRMFNNFKKLSEERTVQIIIIIIFAWLLFLFLFFFINARLKKQAWGSVKHIWYSVPITLLLVILGFIIGKYYFISFLESSSALHNTFTLASVQIIVSLVLISIYYSITLIYNYSFYEKSIDYLIVISCFINQSFFILIDISLFPMFMAICILAILSILVKRNSIHIVIFFLMIIPFLPYLISIIKTANFDSLYLFLMSQDYVSIFIPLIIYPSYLIYFRILASIRRKTKINIPVLIGIIAMVLSAITFISGMVTSKRIESKYKKNEDIYILATTEDLIELEYNDKMVFDDVIRTINLDFKEQPEQCNVTVTAISTSPILYTENAFEYISSTSSMFTIPGNPPKSMTFKYGSTKEPTIITVSAVFKNTENNEYKSTKKVVTIGRK